MTYLLGDDQGKYSSTFILRAQRFPRFNRGLFAGQPVVRGRFGPHRRMNLGIHLPRAVEDERGPAQGKPSSFQREMTRSLTSLGWSTTPRLYPSSKGGNGWVQSKIVRQVTLSQTSRTLLPRVLCSEGSSKTPRVSGITTRSLSPWKRVA